MAKRNKPPKIIKAWQAQIGELASVVDTARPALVKALEKVIAAQIARGQDPTGQPWKKTREGKTPLVRAARAVRVQATGNVLTVSVTGHHARHHLGAVKGKIKRRILPSKSLPNPYAVAVRRVLVAEFDKIMGGKS